MEHVKDFKDFIITENVKNEDLKNIEVELSSSFNPDDLQRKSIRPTIKKHKIKATSIKHAVKIVRDFIEEYDLGGGNYDPANIYADGKKIGYISYNGRIWDNDGKALTID